MKSETLPRVKGLLFVAILWFLLLVVPLFALEALVRVVGWQAGDDPYIHFGRVTSFFGDAKIDGVSHKQVKARDLYRERQVSFATQKPANTFRVFCLGGSASAGWPHPAEETYSAYLKSALELAYPHRKIEVLNVSAHAYAAYRVRLIQQEVLAFQPDLIVIYSGNNEFIEPRLYATRRRWYDAVAALAQHSTAYRLIRGSALGSRLFPQNTLRADFRGGVAFEQWSKIEELPLVLRTDPGQLEKVAEHYEFSITSMVKAAKDKDIPVILLTVPTNLRDWRPNVSVVSVQGDREKQWGKAYLAGQAALLKSDTKLAVESLTRAAMLDPGHAATHYYLGRALEAAGRLDEAHTSYDRARNLDANPFRTISRFNEIIRRIGEAFDNATVVDMEAHFRAASYPHAPGFDLFLDYVHPTKKGNLILAKNVFDTVVSGGSLGPAGAPFRHVPETQEDGTTYDETTDYNLQHIMVVLAMIMHQNETVVSRAERILASPDGLKVLDEEDAYSVTTAHELFRQIVELERRELLTGTVLNAERYKLSPQLDELYQATLGNHLEYQIQRRQQ
jgi:tetratricopeptide (TPR) repeat protein